MSKGYEVYTKPEEWRAQLDKLPTGGRIPSVFLAHGQPAIIGDAKLHRNLKMLMGDVQGPEGTLTQFLKDLGPALIKKYNPRGIIVVSAHYEASPIEVTNYDENPLFMDFYNFDPYFYAQKFESKGDPQLTSQILSKLKEHSIPARAISQSETRGRDGRGGQGKGLDHGAYMPLILMLGHETQIPIVQVSLDSSLDPEREWNLGRALSTLRDEGYLIISGGLTIHTFQDISAFNRDLAGQIYKDFERAIIDAAEVDDPEARKKALLALTKHEGFRPAHPREEHFVPLYVAAGAASEGRALVLSGPHGAKTIAFGLD